MTRWRVRGDAVLEVMGQAGGEAVAATALDAVGHPEGHVRRERRVEQRRVARTLERGQRRTAARDHSRSRVAVGVRPRRWRAAHRRAARERR
jgi:hypothetical protein